MPTLTILLGRVFTHTLGKNLVSQFPLTFPDDIISGSSKPGLRNLTDKSINPGTIIIKGTNFFNMVEEKGHVLPSLQAT